MGRKSNKGSVFEREFCVKLSRWWTDDERDDVFWRTGGSGGRATVRTQRGKATAGQYGDVMATDPIGQPLIKVLTMELKRGYSKANIHDVIDKTKHNAIQTWEAFINQAQRSHKEAGSLAWMIVTKRDRKAEWMWMPHDFLVLLKDVGGFASRPIPSGTLTLKVRRPRQVLTNTHKIFNCSVDAFLDQVSPGMIKRLHRRNFK